MEIGKIIVLILSWLALFGEIIAGGLLISVIAYYFYPKGKTILHAFVKFISANYVSFVFLVAIVATVGSFSLSEIANFNPCKLCWWQRIFMYPQAVIAGVALLTNDTKIKKYIFPLSIIGFSIATYHYVMQLFPDVLNCSEEVAKCSTIQFASFGYMTIPLMSAIAFFLIILICLAGIKLKK